MLNVRTFVGKIPFNHVSHPEQAQHMIEEYWNRTKEHARGMEKEAMKNAIRKRLGACPASSRVENLLSAKSLPHLRPSRMQRATASLNFLGREHAQAQI